MTMHARLTILVASMVLGIALPFNRAPAATAAAYGTGAYISPKGAILTAAHVVRGCEQIQVVDPDDARYPATVRYADQDEDVAVLDGRPPRSVGGDFLRIATWKGHALVATAPAFLGLHEPAEVAPGDHVLVAGFDNETLRSFGETILGNKYMLRPGRVIDAKWKGQRETTFFVSSSITSGNSGAAVVDSHGSLVGVVFAKSADPDDYSGAATGLAGILPALLAADVEVQGRQISDRASGPMEPWTKEFSMQKAAAWAAASIVRVVCRHLGERTNE